ncbi:MarR family winged helix-turn-helix transcriptional regulator [Paenibacillus ginsengarvi]|uniref:MarR family transcriptional regulator n=1 Tax=Paenibacillus ginsengarvi TaxID=400777 RepID=A0A3B0CHS0_9BACL|nr:MarR family transcriptional regulator [Paenibacillus ginsengarvi]RKN84923.1 MarR family transcriptional regulator [Paenibacillus ginsengarvi]
MQETKNESLHLFIVLTRASQWVNAHADRHIRKLGLNRTEFGVLELLYHKGRQPLQQIGDKILMTSGNITYVVDKLEKKELVVRVGDPNDRRVWYAEITPKGVKFIEDVFAEHTAVIEEALRGLDQEEKETAVRLLKKLGRSAQSSFKE